MLALVVAQTLSLLWLALSFVPVARRLVRACCCRGSNLSLLP